MRLCVTLLAVTGMLARAVMPLPAQAHDVATDLKSLGAALCHSDGGEDEPGPVAPLSCDHCPVCGISGAAPIVLSIVNIEPPGSLTVDRTPLVRRDANTRPRAPPRHAHSPRAPPLV